MADLKAAVTCKSDKDRLLSVTGALPKMTTPSQSGAVLLYVSEFVLRRQLASCQRREVSASGSDSPSIKLSALGEVTGQRDALACSPVIKGSQLCTNVEECRADGTPGVTRDAGGFPWIRYARDEKRRQLAD